MSVVLLDVNVLVALFDEEHVNYEDAHRWFGRNRRHGWATCPLTVNGCIRILSNPTYPNLKTTPDDMVGRLKSLCASTDHHFWPDSVSLLYDTLFLPAAIGVHQKITDAYLLGLAVRNHGRLATFDRAIPLRAVLDAGPGDVVLIESV